MSVLLETSVGDIVIDLYCEQAPTTCDNFLKLCTIKYYNDCTFHTVQHNFLIQTGDPTNTGQGGECIAHIVAAASAAAASSASAPPKATPATSRFLQDELHPSLSHAEKYTVAMASLGVPDSSASQFYITAAPGLRSLDGRHTVFGRVAEGMDVVDRINAVAVDSHNRPAVHIRIRHTVVLQDPFPSAPDLLALIPPASPVPVSTPFDYEVIHAAAVSTEQQQPASDAALLSTLPSSDTAAVNPHAVVLEMIGDLPSADAAPAENVLFVCKLNPVTTSEDLQLIFSRFGSIMSCEIVRDGRTGASLCYAFVEFAERSACEAAYVKMDNVLIDDRRIRVDFSQSVSRQWRDIRRQQRTQHPPLAARATRWGERKESGGEVPAQSGRREERKDGARDSDISSRGRHDSRDNERPSRDDRRGREKRDEEEERKRKKDKERERRHDKDDGADRRSRPHSGHRDDQREQGRIDDRHHHSSSRLHLHHRDRRDLSPSRSPSRSRSPHRR